MKKKIMFVQSYAGRINPPIKFFFFSIMFFSFLDRSMCSSAAAQKKRDHDEKVTIL